MCAGALGLAHGTRAAGAEAGAETATQADGAGTVAASAAAPVEAPAPEMVNVAGVDWYTDYYAAYRAAADQRRFLLINVTPTTATACQQAADNYIATTPRLQEHLANVVRLRVPTDATISVEGRSQRLTSFGAFGELAGGSGFVLIDLRNIDEPYYGYPVTVLPFASGKYYRWRPDYLSVVMNIPPGTLTQRSMVFAVRVHPENPQSTYGMQHPSLTDGATMQASYQASVGVQGHQNFETRFHTLERRGRQQRVGGVR